MCRDSLRKINPYGGEIGTEKVTHLGGTSSITNIGSTLWDLGQKGQLEISFCERTVVVVVRHFGSPLHSNSLHSIEITDTSHRARKLETLPASCFDNMASISFRRFDSGCLLT